MTGPRRRDECRRTQRGFTLLEVVLALALLVLSLGGLYNVFATNLSRSHDDMLRRGAIHAAQSALAETLATQPVRDRQGTNGRYRWSVTVQSGTTLESQPSNWTVADVQVEIRWDVRDSEQRLEFMTRRIVATRSGDSSR